MVIKSKYLNAEDVLNIYPDLTRYLGVMYGGKIKSCNIRLNIPHSQRLD